MSQEVSSPKGQLLLRTVAMPADTNANGDIFGGWTRIQLRSATLVNIKQPMPFL
jgi:acyl-CoA thioesterase YciA